MLEFKADIVIKASPKAVWPVLIDTAHWRDWDPNCLKVEGKVDLGAKLKIWSKLSPKRAFPVKVTDLVLYQKLVFTGGMPLGLFQGVRVHTLREIQGNSGVSISTQFAMHETFSGPLLALFKKSIPDMTDAFETFCKGLKNRVENPPVKP